MKEENGIGEVAYHLPHQPGPFVVIFREHFQAGGQAAALLPGMQQRRVEGRQPTAHTGQGFAES